MDLKIGDLVQLKSGGPTMTVKAIVESNKAECVWFNGGNGTYELKHNTFQLETLCPSNY